MFDPERGSALSFDWLGFRVARNESSKTMAELVGNLLVAQSGGPTAVINASVAGVIQEAGKPRLHRGNLRRRSTASSACSTRN